jgi:prepilin-type N-terminal cleavage/methylation domain-containing protein
MAHSEKGQQDERADHGFTLIELLVVIVIIGILAAIAIPSFLAQRQKALEASMKSDLRVVAGRMETYFIDQFAYPTDLSPFTGDIAISPGNSVTVETAGAVPGSFCLKVVNTNAPFALYYDSDRGGIQVRGVSCS